MISVCIATHNGEKYIKEQLESILVQLSIDDEVVISDDGSTDYTLPIIYSLNDSRIRVLHLKHSKLGKKAHYYVTKNFENALINAKGNFIYLADQDDVWYCNKVEICQRELSTYKAVLHNLECVDESLKSLNFKWYNENRQFRRRNYLMLDGKHMGCALAFRRELLNVILPFPENLHVHDFWIGILSEKGNGLKFIDCPLVKYRIHNSNTSGAAHKENSTLFKFYYRVYILFHYIIRTYINSIKHKSLK